MFTAYIKYISLLLISGLILIFCQINAPVKAFGLQSAKAVAAVETARQNPPFSFFKNVILPLFPSLNKL